MNFFMKLFLESLLVDFDQVMRLASGV